MEAVEIEKLVQKYWEGESSVEEERLLRKYWAGQPAAAADEGLGDYMDALEQVKNIRLQKRFSFNDRPFRIQRLLKWTSIAAAFFIGVSLCVLWFNHYQSQRQLLMMHNELEADLMSMSKMLNQAYSESLELEGTKDLKIN